MARFLLGATVTTWLLLGVISVKAAAAEEVKVENQSNHSRFAHF